MEPALYRLRALDHRVFRDHGDHLEVTRIQTVLSITPKAKRLKNPKGADARHQERRNTPLLFRWPLATATVWRVFLKRPLAEGLQMLSQSPLFCRLNGVEADGVGADRWFPLEVCQRPTRSQVEGRGGPPNGTVGWFGTNRRTRWPGYASLVGFRRDFIGGVAFIALRAQDSGSARPVKSSK